MESREDIKFAIYKRRRKLGLSQCELGNAIGITKSGVSKIEKLGYISNDIRIKLNKVLGLNIPLKPIKAPVLTLKQQIEALQEENNRLKGLLKEAWMEAAFNDKNVMVNEDLEEILFKKWLETKNIKL